MDLDRLSSVLTQLVQVASTLSDEIERLKRMEEAQDDSLQRYEAGVARKYQEIISELQRKISAHGGSR